MKKTLLILTVFLILATLSFSLDDFSLAVFGVGKYTNVDSVGNIGLYSNTPSYEFRPYDTVYIGVSQINQTDKITSVKFSLYLNSSTTPISGYSDIPIQDNGIAPDILANDGVFVYSLNLSNISGLKHNDYLTVKVTAAFNDSKTINRELKFLIDSTSDFNTYKVGDIRNAVFNSGEGLKVNFINHTPIELNADNADLINSLTISQLSNLSNSLSFSNLKRNTFFITISDPSNPSDAAHPGLPIFSATNLSVANINVVKYAYSGAWKETITTPNQSYVRKDYIKYLNFTADEPSQWWKITALGICASPTSPVATMTFRLVDSNNTTLASFTGPAKSEEIDLSSGGVSATISVDDPSKLATKTETTMLYIENFSENFILNFKPHIYGIRISQNPTYENSNVKISFYNDYTGSVNFIVYDSTGKEIYSASKNIEISKNASDTKSFVWDFKDSKGNRVCTGKKYYFKIIPFVVDTSSGETIYGPFVYGNIFLRLPVGTLTGVTPTTVKTGKKVYYTFNLSEPATVSIELTNGDKVFYSSESKIVQSGNYKSSLTIPSSATDGVYKFLFDAKTLNFETKNSTSIYVDNTPPVIAFSLTQYGTSIILSGTTDLDSQGINVKYDLYSSASTNTKLIQTTTETVTDGKLYKQFSNLKKGYYDVVVTASDPVGNTSSMEEGISLAESNVVLTQGSTLTSSDGEITLVVPPQATNNSYAVSITKTASNDEVYYTFDPSISLSKNATLIIKLPSIPDSNNIFVVSTFNGRINLMMKLSSQTTYLKIKDIQKISIKKIENAKVVTFNFDKIVYSSPMKIYINNYEEATISLYIMDLSGEVVKKIAQNLSLSPGYHELDWDLTNRFGSEIPNGQYIIYLVSNGSNTAKLFGVKK